MPESKHKPAQTRAPIHPLLAARWSPRSFGGRVVEDHTIAAMAEAARWAPSCFGAEPWRFVICNKEKNEAAWDKAFASLAEGNRWAKNAQLLVLVCGEKAFAHNGGENRHCRYDSGAAAMSFVLEAENQGLRCHQMAGFDAEAARAAFAVPDAFECLSMLAVGYQAGAEMLEGELRERETAERTRRPLAESFFDGEWGKAADFGE
ncbi:MAG: nitroreductase [Betaproteobacteria bacterium]|nr:nitroreductase [Betaproteobacteria bacterium]